MKIQTQNRIAVWQKMLTELSWTPKHAPHSASIAFSKAEWLGIRKEQAIQKVLEMSVSTFLTENPHVLLETWRAVSEQMASPEDDLLRACRNVSTLVCKQPKPDFEPSPLAYGPVRRNQANRKCAEARRN